MERVEATIVHLVPWVNVIIPGFLGLPAAVLAWSFRRHAAPWTSHACKQVIVWQLLSVPFFLVAAVFLRSLLQTPETGYAIPSLFHPVFGPFISIGQLVLVPFAFVSTLGSLRTAQGHLFRYPIVGDFIKPPREEDKRTLF
jgi:uncharacterized Tic20 family protein